MEFRFRKMRAAFYISNIPHNGSVVKCVQLSAQNEPKIQRKITIKSRFDPKMAAKKLPKKSEISPLTNPKSML
jgi:hypothetical protein